MKRILQHAHLVTVQRQVVEYLCDHRDQVCGTRANPKERWTGRDGEKHYCKRTCSPFKRRIGGFR